MDWDWAWRVLAGIVLVWLVLLGLLWVFRPRNVPLGEFVRIVPDLLRMARSLIGDRTAPLSARLALLGLLAWLLNPVDLVPEFIPVLGPLDDLVVAVLVLRHVRRRLGEREMRRRWPGTEDGYRLLSGVLGSSSSSS